MSLEQQAYFLVKHVNISLSDVGSLTLIERTAYMKLFNEEKQKESEELEQLKRSSTK